MKDEVATRDCFILHPSAFILALGDVAQLDKKSVGLVNRTIRVRLPSSPPYNGHGEGETGRHGAKDVCLFSPRPRVAASPLHIFLWRSQVGKAPHC
jgi:hypothetical protein